MPDIELLLTLMTIATVAGWVDAIAGGGGVIILPSLLMAGLPPLQALATNKLQASFGSGTATLNFLRQGQLNWRGAMLAVACTFIGAACGTHAVRWLPREALNTLIPMLLIGLALFLLFGTRNIQVARSPRLSNAAFALLVGSSIGFYDGFFGPGTGTFFAVAHMMLRGQSMVTATANTKLLNFTSNLAALLFFMFSGQVQWIIGLTMAVGQILGAWIGSTMVVSRGAPLIRPIMIWMSIIISIKLLLFPDGFLPLTYCVIFPAICH